MHTVILNGSPRIKGNTSCIIERLLEGIHSVAGSSAEVIDLSRKTLLPCMACDGCKKSGGGRCVLKDDSGDILEALTRADAIVFASPVYFWGISAQLKLIVDKFYSSEEQLRGKKIGLMVVGADGLESPQYRLIHEQFGCIAKFLDWEILFDEKVSAGAPGEVLKNTVLMQRLFEIGAGL